MVVDAIGNANDQFEDIKKHIFYVNDQCEDIKKRYFLHVHVPRQLSVVYISDERIPVIGPRVAVYDFCIPSCK